MNEKYKLMFIAVLTLTVIAAAIFLPPVAANAFDGVIIGKVYQEEAEKPLQDVSGQISMIEKLQIMEELARETTYDGSAQNMTVERSNISVLRLEKGREMTEKLAGEACVRELQTLMDLGICPSLDIQIEITPYASFYIDTTDASRSFVAWHVRFRGVDMPGKADNIFGNAVLDDATGMILKYQIEGKSVEGEQPLAVYKSAEEVLAIWGEYLKLTLTDVLIKNNMTEGESMYPIEFMSAVGTYEQNQKQIMLPVLINPYAIRFGYF